jgi:autotransporter-associated beta strand protein
MTANNNYTGTTTINGGTIAVGVTQYSTPFGNGLVVVNSGGTLDLNGVSTYTFSQGITGNGLVTSSTGYPYIGMGGSGWAQTFGGSLTHLSLDFNSSNATWTLSGSSGGITNGFNIGHVAEANASTIIITGTVSADLIRDGHSGAGNIVVNGGLVSASGYLSVSDGQTTDLLGTGNFILNSGTVIAPTVESARAATSAVPTNTFQLNGGVLQTSQVILEPNANSTAFMFTMNGGTILVSAGGTLFQNGGSSNGNEVAVQIGAGGAFINTNGFNTSSVRPITDGTAGPGALTKLGAGTLTLSSSNSYTGSTTVSAGTLLVSGSLSGTSSTSVASGATLEVDGLLNNSASTSVRGVMRGTGSVGGITASGGAVAPGLTAANTAISTGTLTANGAVTLSSTTNFDIRLGLSASGTDNDQLAVTGANTVSLAGANLQLTLGLAVNNPARIGTYYLIINGGSGSTEGSNEFAQGTSFTTSGGFTFAIDYATNFLSSTSVNDIGTGNDVVLELTAIPEPGTWATMLSGFGVLLFVQRMRRKSRR